MHPPSVQPYLFFGGRCDEAIAFYRDAIGAQLEMRMQFDESPVPLPPEAIPHGFGNKVMHAALRIGQHTVLISDGNGDSQAFQGFALSLLLANEASARQAFEALSAGGEITLPLSATFWSGCFGMLRDRFGVAWMVGIAPSAAA